LFRYGLALDLRANRRSIFWSQPGRTGTGKGGMKSDGKIFRVRINE